MSEPIFILQCSDPHENLWSVYDGEKTTECYPFGSPPPKTGICAFRRIRDSLQLCFPDRMGESRKFIEVCHDSKVDLAVVYARANDVAKLRREGLVY